jgi:hypothetical protein
MQHFDRLKFCFPRQKITTDTNQPRLQDNYNCLCGIITSIERDLEWNHQREDATTPPNERDEWLMECPAAFPRQPKLQ